MLLLREELNSLLGMLSGSEAVALLGPRRAGKSSLARLAFDQWLNKGKPGEFIDLELLDSPKDPFSLRSWIEKTPKGCLVVLDEVQNVQNWEAVVREQVEYKKRKLVITGSNATLLSSELATSLGGRAFPFKVLPLSFRDAKLWGISSLGKFLDTGGYPECVLRPEDASKLHSMYLELALIRDIATRKKVRNLISLENLAKVILSEPGKNLSIKKLSTMLDITPPTVRSFIQYFNEAFLTFQVPPFFNSPLRTITADSKHYAYDTGLQKTVSISKNEDSGRRYENLVAIELLRQGYSLSYARTSDCECDFIASGIGKQKLAIQVYTGEGPVPEREVKGLELGMLLGKCKGLFLALEQPEPQIKAKGMETLLIGEWLLGKKT